MEVPLVIVSSSPYLDDDKGIEFGELAGKSPFLELASACEKDDVVDNRSWSVRQFTNSRSVDKTKYVQSQAERTTFNGTYEPKVVEALLIESYEGEKNSDGVIDGHGVAHFVTGHVYEGDFVDGLMHGKGVFKWAETGVIYEGEFKCNFLEGEGMYTWPDGSVYKGQHHLNLRHGFGTFRLPKSSAVYTGEWFCGQRHGKGRLDYDDSGKNYYDGSWYFSVRQGFGLRAYGSGSFYHGQWQHNVQHGMGLMYWADFEESYNGDWVDGLPDGIGEYTCHRKLTPETPTFNRYVGQWFGGVRHGKGTYYFADGGRYEGNFYLNVKHGEATYIGPDGSKITGTFRKDELIEEVQHGACEEKPLCRKTLGADYSVPELIGKFVDGNSPSVEPGRFQMYCEAIVKHMQLECDMPKEILTASMAFSRYMYPLSQIYNIYAVLGKTDKEITLSFKMNRLTFWRFLADCKIYQHGLNLTVLDDFLSMGQSDVDAHVYTSDIQWWDFCSAIILIAFQVYGVAARKGTSMCILDWCLRNFIEQNLKPIFTQDNFIGGRLFADPKRAAYVLRRLPMCLKVFCDLPSNKCGFCHGQLPPARVVYDLFQTLELVNSKRSKVTTSALTGALLGYDAVSHPDKEGIVSLNFEAPVVFLSFLEVVYMCGEYWQPETDNITEFGEDEGEDEGKENWCHIDWERPSYDGSKQDQKVEDQFLLQTPSKRSVILQAPTVKVSVEDGPETVVLAEPKLLVDAQLPPLAEGYTSWSKRMNRFFEEKFLPEASAYTHNCQLPCRK